MSRPILTLVLVHALGASPLLGQTSALPDLGRETPLEHARMVLERVERLAIGARVEPGGARHVGPSPEAFFAAFGLGTESGIEPGDASAVALIAIQALAHHVHALQEENAAMRATTNGLQNEVDRLRGQLERLEGERR
jgi:hypothetical protein